MTRASAVAFCCIYAKYARVVFEFSRFAYMEFFVRCDVAAFFRFRAYHALSVLLYSGGWVIFCIYKCVGGDAHTRVLKYF